MDEMNGGWTAEKPKVAGVFAVSGFSLSGKSHAVVEVVNRAGRLVVNMHEINTERDIDNWFDVKDLAERMRWKYLAPPIRAAAEIAKGVAK